MKASALIFRFRFLVHVVLFVLGFWTPWDHPVPLAMDRNGTTWLQLASWFARNHWLSFTDATIGLLAVGTLCALAGAILRTWASAYLGTSIVMAGAMHGEGVVADGPYRFLRNPLYLGIICNALALSLLMVPSGTVFTLVTVILFQFVLIAIEEPFLREKLGEPYVAYSSKVPRIVPALTPQVADSGARPRWATALIGESYQWGVVVTFLVAGWKYNASLLVRGILISLGVSLILRALAPAVNQAERPATE